MPRVDPPERTATLEIRVLPRASRNEIAWQAENRYRVKLTAPPVEGKANQALIKLLARHLVIPKRDISILAGSSSRTKTIRVAGLTAAEAIRRLKAACQDRKT